MRKRSLFFASAAGLLASLALSTPGQAGVVYTYTIAPTSPQTLTATSYGTGSASITFTAAPLVNPQTTPSDITVATYTQTATGNGISGFPPTVNGGYYNDQSASQTVTVTYMGQTGTFKVTETMNGLAYAGNLITPGITSTAPIVIDGVHFAVYEQGTSYNINTGKSSVFIGIESTAVPEPTSMALLGIGMAGFLAFRKYFKRPLIA